MILCNDCLPTDAELTDEERRNMRTVMEQMSADEVGWGEDPAEGRRRLEAILADDFISGPFSKQEYINLITRDLYESFRPGSHVKIFGMTLEGDRAAVELGTDAVLKNSVPYTNRYHLLFIFDDDGRVREYKYYMDTAIFIRDTNLRIRSLAVDFFRSLSSGGTTALSYMLAEDFLWTIAEHGQNVVSLSREQALARVAGLQYTIRGLRVEPFEDSYIVQGTRVVVAAAASGVIDQSGAPYRADLHFILEVADALFMKSGDMTMKHIQEFRKEANGGEGFGIA